MSTLDLNTATIASLAPDIASRRLSPVEVVQATLDRIQRLNPTLKAFLTVTGDHAMERAREAEREIVAGRCRGPLHGIPFSLKDVIATKDVPTTYGHPRLHDFKPEQDATVRTLLEEAGAILVGKVYSQIGRGDSIVDCRNPWDTTRSPGTSSSGSGSAVAASIGLLSIGTDTGGSVRHPRQQLQPRRAKGKPLAASAATVFWPPPGPSTKLGLLPRPWRIAPWRPRPLRSSTPLTR